MNRWLRRFLIFLGLIAWLVVMAFPFTAFILATQGQMQIGSDPASHVRLFLIQEEDSQGVGLEWIRPSRQRSNCSQGTISYFLWEGDGENVSYCQCFDPATESTLSVENQSCKE